MTQEVYAIIRLRGKAGTRHSVKKTMELLRLHKVNHGVVFHKTDTLEGMLKKAKDRVTWGEITKDALIHLLTKRGELYGKEKTNITNKYLSENTKYKSISDFTDAFFKGEAKITDIPKIQPVFRLSPPKKGFKSVKNPWRRGGDLGYRD